MIQFEVVLHVDYGGFCFDQEMAEWLQEHRGWTITTDELHRGPDKVQADIIGYGRDYFLPQKFRPDDVALRTNPDVLDCVKALKELHKDEKWPARRERYIHKLKIVSVDISVDIINYHDGKEKLAVHASY